jgi:hypothetical protein
MRIEQALFVGAVAIAGVWAGSVVYGSPEYATDDYPILK